MGKLKLALYWAGACGGCDVSVLDTNERILKIAELADLLLWPIASEWPVLHDEVNHASEGRDSS